ncbi:MAG: VOC family protein [Pseudomonadota bacterium]
MGTLGPCSPLLIVSDLERSLRHYVDALGFAVRHLSPQPQPFFAIVGRDSAQLMLKEVGPDIQPTPNPTRHPWAQWDVLIYCEAPDTLHAELAISAAAACGALDDTDDGLRGFTTIDPDGYVCMFAKPIGD